jgi:hypothetical protein
MAVAMAGGNTGGNVDLKSSSILVGKALNDPIKGLTALTRVGVSFTDQQKKNITSLVDQGNVMGAQKIILGELQSEFGGTAAAQATMGDKVTVAWKNIEENIGTGLLPLIDEVEKAFLKKAVPALQDFSNWFQKDGTKKIQEFVNEAKPLANSLLPAVGTGFKDVAGFLKNAAPYAKKTIDAFNSLPGWAQKAVVLGTAGGLLAKKTGILSAGTKALTGGGAGGLLSAAKGTPVDPIWVAVVNGGKPGVPTTVPTSPGKSVAGEVGDLTKRIPIPPTVGLAVGAQIAKGIFGGISIFKHAAATPTPSDPNALKASRIGELQGLKLDDGRTIEINFEKLSKQLDVVGSKSKYLAQIRDDLKHIQGDGNPTDPNSALGRATGALHDLNEAAKLADVGPPAFYKALVSQANAAQSAIESVTRPIQRASAAIDLASHSGSGALRGLGNDTDAFGNKMKGATNRTEVLEGTLRRFPKKVRTELDLDTTAAEKRLATLRAHAGRHISASLSIELAGRGPGQAALDGVNR